MRILLLVIAIAAAVAVSGLSLAGSVSVRADLINMVWPVQLGAGLVILALLLVVRTPRLAPARSIALACAAALTVAGTPWAMMAPSGGATSPTPPQLTVTTFNAWASNTDIDLAEAGLRAAGSHVIALQEIGLNTADLPARLADLYPHQLRCRWGVRLISKLAFAASGCSDQLPAAWARIEVDGRDVTIVGVHVARPLAPAWYRGHSAALAELAGRFDGPRLILGDFNTGEGGFLMAGQARRLAPLERVTHGLRTWPSRRLTPAPILGIDHIWLSPELEPTSIEVGPHLGSDHRPVTAGLHFAAQDPGTTTAPPP